MRAGARDPWFLALCGAALLLLVLLFAAGALTGAFNPDTLSYLKAAASGEPWGQPRHPAYGFVAGLLGASETATGHVAQAQALLHVTASIVLYWGARYGGIGRAGAFALAAAALFSQSGLYHLRLVVPESVANSCLLIAFGMALAASGWRGAFRLLVVPIALFIGAAYLARPSHLPAIVAVAALYGLFAWRNHQSRPVLRAAVLMLAAALPFLAQSAVRLRAVGDFNIVSFGGYQMSPLAGFMLTPEIVARLPEPARQTAQAILTAREKAENDGLVAHTPLNSSGERSFASAALGYFDIYARSYDELLQHVIVPLQDPNESWVAFNRRLMAFSFATVTTAPSRWAAWIGGATTRLTGRAIVTNAPMLAAGLVLLVAAMPAFLRRRPLGVGRDDLGAVSIVALGWLACTAPLSILVTFPASRYIDTAALLLPAIPLSLAIALFRKLAREPDSGDALA